MSALRLRPWDGRDMPALAALLEISRDHLRPWVPVPHGALDPAAWMDWAQGDGVIARAVVAAAGPESLLGGCELRRGPHDSAQVGLWIGAPHAGRGHGTAALRALAREAFAVHGLRRLEWRCEARHHASRRLAARAGFVHEGTRRQARRTVADDDWADEVILARLWSDPAGG